MKVLHVMPRWGALTEGWIATQVRNPHTSPSILCADGDAGDGDIPVLTRSSAPRWCRTLDNRVGAHLQTSAVLAWALERVRPDVVHYHFGQTPAPMWRTPLLARTPSVVSFYGYDASYLVEQEPAWRDRYRRYLPRLSATIAEGPAMRARLIDLGAPADQALVLRIGVSLDDLPWAPRPRGRRESLRILMAGRFVQKKGFPIGIEAAGRLLARHPGSVERVTLVGDINDHPRSRVELEHIEQAAAQWLPHGVLHRPGLISRAELIATAREHDILLVPSFLADDGDSEGGSPVVATELGATGTVVVSSDHADLPSLVVNDETGLVAPARDADALSHALDRIWRTSTVGPRLARAMRLHVDEHYSLPHMHQRLATTYKRVVTAR